MITRSPTLTSKGFFLPSSSILPVPMAMTFASWGFSLAVSGMMIPPFLTSPSSSGCTSTRSPRGRNVGFAIFCLLSFGCWFVVKVVLSLSQDGWGVRCDVASLTFQPIPPQAQEDGFKLLGFGDRDHVRGNDDMLGVLTNHQED